MSVEWQLDQQNLIVFVMIDGAGTEVTGLGAAFNPFVSKAGGAFVVGTGARAEIGNGWYSYLASAVEADTIGPVAVRVTGAGAIQQNLEYVVRLRTVNAIAFTYTVTSSVPPNNPIPGVQIYISTDITDPPSNVVWAGTTDALGVARDSFGNLPHLDAGTYYFWSYLAGYTFVNPDTEIVS